MLTETVMAYFEAQSNLQAALCDVNREKRNLALQVFVSEAVTFRTQGCVNEQLKAQ
jgi:cell fate (sporulation/competence/biofilm development) regulator YlbF (YheA/YmcA/DUF963 family)